jgi:hypothetical protein
MLSRTIPASLLLVSLLATTGVAAQESIPLKTLSFPEIAFAGAQQSQPATVAREPSAIRTRWMLVGLAIIGSGFALEVAGHRNRTGTAAEANGSSRAGAILGGAGAVVLVTKGVRWRRVQIPSPQLTNKVDLKK